MNATTVTTLSNIHHCARCGLPYDWRRSTSKSLKMTYCSALCEKGDLGFTIETLLEAKAFAPERPVAAPVELLPEWTGELIAA